jgi:Tol biopolymer transport system component
MLAAAVVLTSFPPSTALAATGASPFELVSVSTSGTAANGAKGGDHSAVSADGRFVVFRSGASNLVPGVSGNQIYLRDRTTRKTELVSQPSGTGNTAGASSSDWPSISNDGCRIVFESDATNLVNGDGNHSTDVFLRDRCANPPTTSFASVSSQGTQGGGQSKNGDISGDGHVVVFWSYAIDLVQGVSNRGQVYRHDLTTGATTLVSDNGGQTGKGGNHSSDCPSVSSDGNRVAFWSYANDIVGGVDPSGVWNIYVYDATSSPHTQRASSNASGVAQDLGSNSTSAITCPVISGDGRFVAFASGSGNLVADDHNGISDMFLKDLSTGEVRRLSVAGSGAEANGPSTGRPAISATGGSVAFSTDAANLAPENASGGPHIVVRDWASGQTTGLTSASSSGDVPGMSNDVGGTYVTSYWNGKLDPKVSSTGVFLYKRAANEPPVANAGPDFEYCCVVATGGLDGRASSDPEGHALTYLWSSVSGPGPAQATNPTAATSGFLLNTAEGAYVFQLIVNDGVQDSAPDFITVTRTGYPIPVASAGPDTTAGVDGSVTLDGSGSTAYLNGTLTYAWTQTVGPMAIQFIGGATSVSPRFVPRQVGTYTFRLIVNDGEHSSTPSYVSISVIAAASVKTPSAVVNGATSGTVLCPKAVAKSCSVSVTLAVDPTARAKGAAVAHTTAKLTSGTRAKVKLKWSTAGLKLLKAKRSLPMLLTVVTRAPGAPKRTVVSRFIARGR